VPTPQLATLVEMLRQASPIAGGDVATMRAGMDAATAGFAAPADVRFEPVDAGGVPAEWTTAPGAREDRALVLPVTGDDLVAAGLAGPDVGRALARIRAALLDRAIASRDDALELAREIAAGARRAHARPARKGVRHRRKP